MPCKMFHVEHFTGFSLFSVLYTSVAYSLAGSCGGVVGCCTGRPSLPTGMRTMYSRHPSCLSQWVVAWMPFWVIRSTACCRVFTKKRTSRTMGMVRRQGLGLLGAANIWSTSLSASRTLSLSRAIFSSAGVRRLSGRRRAARAWRSVRWLAVQSCCCSGDLTPAALQPRPGYSPTGGLPL